MRRKNTIIACAIVVLTAACGLWYEDMGLQFNGGNNNSVALFTPDFFTTLRRASVKTKLQFGNLNLTHIGCYSNYFGIRNKETMTVVSIAPKGGYYVQTYIRPNNIYTKPCVGSAKLVNQKLDELYFKGIDGECRKADILKAIKQIGESDSKEARIGSSIVRVIGHRNLVPYTFEYRRYRVEFEEPNDKVIL